MTPEDAFFALHRFGLAEVSFDTRIRDVLLLVFFVCCLCVCELSRLLQKPTPEPKETVVNRRERWYNRHKH